MIEFPSVVDAVRCAVQVQHGMDSRNAEIPAEKQIRFRVGINLGDIIIDGDDIHGDGVYIAARLEGLAEPGGICVSDDAYRQVRDKLDYRRPGSGHLTDVLRLGIRTAFEAEKRFWLAEIGQIPPELPLVPVPPSP